MPLKLLSALVLLCLPFAASCVSEEKPKPALVWVDEVSHGPTGNQVPGMPPAGPDGEQGAEGDPTPPETARLDDPDKIVRVPQRVLDELLAFINRPQVLLANRIVVDATRIPFKPTIIPIADPAYVETTETGSPTGNDHVIEMRSRQAVPMVERDRPRVRVGEGIDLLADALIQVRYHRRVSQQRPVYLRMRALGNAVYRDEETGRRLEKDAITFVVELVPGPDGLVLSHSVE